MLPFERLAKFMTKPAIIGAYVLFVLFSFFYLDKWLAQWFYELDLRVNLIWLNWFTRLGLGILYLPSFCLLALFFRYIKKNPIWELRYWFIFLCVLLPASLCLVLKVLLGRARPALWLTAQHYGFYGFQVQADFWSFPSGHTSTIMGLAFGFSILFPRYSMSVIALGILISISRVILYHHYLSDILVAIYLTMLVVYALLEFIKTRPFWQNLNIEQYAFSAWRSNPDYGK